MPPTLRLSPTQPTGGRGRPMPPGEEGEGVRSRDESIAARTVSKNSCGRNTFQTLFISECNVCPPLRARHTLHSDMKICVTHNIVVLRLAGLLIAVCDSQHVQKHINIKNIKFIAQKKIYKKNVKIWYPSETQKFSYI